MKVIHYTTIICPQCGNKAERPRGEVNRSRRLGRPVFCTQKCAATHSNASKKSVVFTTDCPYCNTPFTTSTHNKAAKFCSPSCASKGSMTEERRAAQRLGGIARVGNLNTPEETLKLREASKYSAVRAELTRREIPHEFEYRIGDVIFDLALTDRKLLVEFDGPYHRDRTQLVHDGAKDDVARLQGWCVLRVTTDTGDIPADVLRPFIR